MTNNNFSEYSLYDYWKKKEIDAFQGELSPDSMFLLTTGCAPLPCCYSYNKFSYFNDFKFGAGYLKYVVLGSMANNLLLNDNDECLELPNIDEVLEICIRNNNDKYNVIDKIKHIVEICDRVFCENEKEKQEEYLKKASQKFNEFFEFEIQNVSGWNYTFDIYSGSDGVKDKFLSFFAYSKLLPQIKEILSKKNWSTEDKRIIKNAVDYII